MVVRALSNSSGPRTITTGCISITVGPTASRTSSSMAFANTGFVAWPNTPTRRADGSMSRNNSTLFQANAEAIRDTPVMFPPGCAKLGTIPVSTGRSVRPRPRRSREISARKIGRRDVRQDHQPHGGAHARCGVDLDLAAMEIHDLLHDHQAAAGAGRLRGEERAQD